jgi:hypothetical protein
MLLEIFEGETKPFVAGHKKISVLAAKLAFEQKFSGLTKQSRVCAWRSALYFVLFVYGAIATALH